MGKKLLQSVNCSLNIISVRRWATHVVRMGEMRNDFVGKYEETT
jgi:hypothetical protein